MKAFSAKEDEKLQPRHQLFQSVTICALGYTLSGGRTYSGTKMVFTSYHKAQKLDNSFNFIPGIITAPIQSFYLCCDIFISHFSTSNFRIRQMIFVFQVYGHTEPL